MLELSIFKCFQTHVISFVPRKLIINLISVFDTSILQHFNTSHISFNTTVRGLEPALKHGGASLKRAFFRAWSTVLNTEQIIYKREYVKIKAKHDVNKAQK